MTIREQIIQDIDGLPEHALLAISVIVKEIGLLCHPSEPQPRPVYGSAKGQMWIADDFDAPLHELKEYME